jgi:hypothetical protein
MDNTGPKRPAWWITLVIWAGVLTGLVGILAYLLPIASLAGAAFWLLSIGWLLLAIAAAIIYVARLIRW